MHDEEGPRRLRQGTDTPETLIRALTALRKGVDDSARLERVGQKLEAVLSAPRAAEEAAAASRGFLGNKLSVLKLIVGGLGLLAPLLFFQFMDDDAVPPAPDAGSLQPTAALQKIEQNEPTPIAQPAEPIEAEAAEAPAANVESQRQPEMRAAKTAHSSATRSHKQREVVSKSGAADNGVERDANDVSGPQRVPTASASASHVEPTAVPPTVKEKLVREAEPKADAPPPVSEAGLLLQARKALKSDPANALRLANEHQARFASGRLTPEREVLAIEALRKLGRKLEADERLHKFEAQYPGSIHLKRLHQLE